MKIIQPNYKRNNPKTTVIFIIVSAVVVIPLGIYFSSVVSPRIEREEQKINENYFKNFNESFKGIIVDIKTPDDKLAGGLKQSLLKVKLDYSTTKHYDPRYSKRFFYCIIDFPYVEVFKEHALGYTSVGDSFKFDGIKDTFFLQFNYSEWSARKPNIIDNNIKLLKPFYTIPRYTKEQFEKRKQTYPLPLELPNDYYMLLFGKFRKKEKLAESYKILSKKDKYRSQTIPKYFEKRHGFYYFFIHNKRYGSYRDAFLAWKEASYSELHIAKFDKHNKFIEVLKKQRKK